jgi:hypothetical protein
MSSRKLEKAAFAPVVMDSHHTHLSLASEQVRVRRSGIEFQSPVRLSPWKEMTVDLESACGCRVQCTGVVVACDGSRNAGYAVSMLFTGLSREDQTRLQQLAFSSLA